MPANTKPVLPWTAARHLDLQADLHVFCGRAFQGKTILDIGAGLGRSKARMPGNQVETYEPSPACRHLVDYGAGDSLPRRQIVTAFEVIEHVEDDVAFLRQLDALSTEAVLLTTPNWDVARCQSVDHYREYTYDEFGALLRGVWPRVGVYRLAYYKDAAGGWVGWVYDEPHNRPILKHVALINKGLSVGDLERVAHAVRHRETR